MKHKDTNSFFAKMYPLGSDLGIKPVDAGPGFDTLQLLKTLGAPRYDALMTGVKNVFCCNHAKYPTGHALAGREVQCVYAADLEAFLKAGG